MFEDFNVLSVFFKGVFSFLKIYMNFINIKIIVGLYKK